MQEQDITHLPLRERNKQRVIRRIQEAAFALFRTVGYDQTTMDAIAEKAETSRATLFNYFPTKSSLWIPFLKQLYIERVQPELDVYLETDPSTLQALHFLFTNIFEQVFQFSEAGHAFEALQQKVFHAHPHTSDINKDTGFIDNIQTILQHGQQRGDVRSDIPLEKLTRYVTILYLAHISELFEKHISPEYMLEIDTLLAFLHSGLR